MNPIKVRIVASRLGIDNATARLPFRFGVVTMKAAASLTLALEIEAEGRRGVGYAADLLAYKWFDKRPEKSLEDNVHDLLWAVEEALEIAAAAGARSVFDHWRELEGELPRRALTAGFNKLGASFGISMVERALIDGLGRMAGEGFHELVSRNSLGIDAGAVFGDLAGMHVGLALADRPLQQIALRHTVGLLDPITHANGPGSPQPDDGLPVTLADYLRVDDISHLKVKISGKGDQDLDRLREIAALLDREKRDFRITLDGNEQFRDLAAFAAFMERLRADPALATFHARTLFVEQPLDRAVALSDELDRAALESIDKPLLIDEADGWTSAFREAVALGYSGVSHKNCKGIIRSLLNALLVRKLQEDTLGRPLFLSAEDLTCLPVVSLQADLAVVAALGIAHVERNGHHYFRGLDHLPPTEAKAALAAHPDLYTRAQDRVQLRIADGQIVVGSLQVPGLGAACVPDMEARIAPADWSFAMLNLDDESNRNEETGA